jgi:hypothetical protein
MSCKPGQIRRNSYKKGSYTKKDGTKVKASYVPSGCVQDRGKPGKGPKILPPVSKNISLSKYGYHLNKPVAERQAALRKASKALATLEVERRLNLIRNYSKWEPTNYKKLSADVEYMKKMYADEKAKKSKKGSKKGSKKASRK